ncbi:transcription factor SPN1 [Nematocida major]|uniref:transcription factor SPN1 n=1 Tax=Nematocida major TaxID=1912982 RepID=UPI002007D3B1|nr:transcription factor SPN1 [Nematocida major]KAH9385812.1 transcription factor SPN1 [Nematocida major]
MSEENSAGSTGNLQAQEILAELDGASEADFAANREGRPALYKLNALSSVYGKLVKRKKQEELLDMGLLSSLKKWLEPMSDHSLPHDDVKKAVLEILYHLEPEVDHLQESSIGRIVLFYSKNPYEKKGIRRLARQISLKWIELATEDDAEGY